MTCMEDITPSDKTVFMVAWFGLKSVSFSCLPDSTRRVAGLLVGEHQHLPPAGRSKVFVTAQRHIQCWE